MAEQKKVTQLDEVRADAKFNYLRRLRDEREKQEYEASKSTQANISLRQVAGAEFEDDSTPVQNEDRILENLNPVEKVAFAERGYGVTDSEPADEEPVEEAPKASAAPKKSAKKGSK